MIKKLRPDRIVKNVESIELLPLKESGITVLVIDIDNTLTPHHQDVIDQAKLTWLNQASAMGFSVVLLSNNRIRRLNVIKETYGLNGYGFAFKPFSRYYKKILQQNHCTSQQVCCIGDQLLTDVLGAAMHGMISIYVEPISSRDIVFSRLSRWLERRLLVKKGNTND